MFIKWFNLMTLYSKPWALPSILVCLLDILSDRIRFCATKLVLPLLALCYTLPHIELKQNEMQIKPTPPKL